MKRSIGILLGLLALLFVGVVACAASTIEIQPAVEFMKANVHQLAVVPPIIISSNINEKLINDLKLKFGHIKIITVVVEPAVYDIDQIPLKDRVLFRQLGIDYTTLLNKDLEIQERLKPLELLSEFRDDETKCNTAIELANKYTGKEIEPGEAYQFLVKRPDRGLIKMLLPLAQSGQIDDFADKAVKNLVIDGDMTTLDDGIVFMGVVQQLKQMISPAQSFLSKA